MTDRPAGMAGPTWRGPPPPALPPLGWRDRARGVVRAGLVIGLTAGLIPVYLLARLAEGVAGRGRLAPLVAELWARGAVPLAGLRLTVEGSRIEGPGVIVANHVGWIDIVTLFRTARAQFVAKAEVARWPVIGQIAGLTGTLFISRSRAQAAREQAAIAARLARGDRLILFAEGTSTDGLRVLPFRSALFDVFLRPELVDRVRVQPVSVIYHAPPGMPRAFYGWWADMDFGRHLWQVLALSRGGRVCVLFHPPIDAAAHPTRKALADAAGRVVRAGLEAALGPPPPDPAPAADPRRTPAG